MANFRNIIFYIPYLYTISTRQKKIVDNIRLFIRYVFPIAAVSYFRNGNFIDWYLLIWGFIFVYNLYEIGYIQNDTETIKNEKNPTLRLSHHILEFYYKHRISVYVFRLIITVILTYVLLNLGVDWTPLIIGYMLIPCYLLYNSIRNKYSYFIYLILMLLRYICLVLICSKSITLIDIILLILIHPFPAFIARFSKDRFGYRNKFIHKYIIDSIDKVNLFRLKYYSVLIVLCCLLYFVNKEISILYMMISLVFLVMAFVTNLRDRKHIE